MIAERKFRFGERQKARDTATAGGLSAGLTERDVQNLDAFAAKLSDAIDLLQQEIDAINAGDLNIVSALYEQKADALKWLELKMPLVEPFMAEDAAKARRLPQRLDDLKRVVEENSSLLARMATAAGTVVREIEKATQRHSLNGLYGKTGQKLNDNKTTKLQIDREF
ncbi:MAG: flagellar biosynthesis protein FlgI [Cognatishimia sp.]